MLKGGKHIMGGIGLGMGGHGHIELIFGPMFSGKSSELLRRIRRYRVAKRRCVVLKYIHDQRYGDEATMATHDLEQADAVPCDRLMDRRSEVESYDCIGIDEGQFFPDVVPFCEEMANRGKIVIVAALDGTFERRPFASILDLVPLSESVTKLSAVCMRCFQDAAFSRRLDPNEHKVEVIGGADKYIAVCRSCYLEPASPPPAE